MLRFGLVAIIVLRSVSILTRPEGRVLLQAAGGSGNSILFQSSPGPKAGCYAMTLHISRQSPVVSILTRPEGRVLPGGGRHIPAAAAWFQSSPGPKAGCYVENPARFRGSV